MRGLWIALAALIASSLAGCGCNTLQGNDEQIESNWSEVVNQYQRQADLVPPKVDFEPARAEQAGEGQGAAK